MRRAMYTLEGLGTHDPSSQFDHTQTSTSSYDHPYFGQIVLASVLTIVGYPDISNLSTNINDNVQTIETLYAIPRILMGLLAVLDTFLVYKIAATWYDNKVALIAAILFAVMPLSWLTRRILLDSIMLPLVLISIYFMVSYIKNSVYHFDHARKNSHNGIVLVLLSGIFMGLAIFTKLPAFSIIPLMGFLLLSGRPPARSAKRFGLWFTPVILIPLIWPAYAVSVGDFEEWREGVLWQGSERQGEGKELDDILNIFFKLDPVLLFIGVAGFIIAALKKDFFPLVWSVPYILLMYAVGWATHFHWILLLPAFCIAAALVFTRLAQLVRTRNKVLRVMPHIAATAVTIFGLVNTTIIITSDLSSSQYQAAAFVTQDVKNSAYNTTIISSPPYSWIFRYVLDRDHDFSHIRDSSQPVQTDQILLIADSTYFHVLGNPGEDKRHIEMIKSIYEHTSPIASFRDSGISYDRGKYPYTNVREADIGGGQIVVQANY